MNRIVLFAAGATRWHPVATAPRTAAGQRTIERDADSLRGCGYAAFVSVDREPGVLPTSGYVRWLDAAEDFALVEECSPEELHAEGLAYRRQR